MATQSLYRRYRPRRFSELKGQEHVVLALRNAVVNGREGQAYLFSGPRGTGKTTSARILAKVLNCEHPLDGEPCCQCASCLAVEAGTSYDVHELDAASNNGVEAIRDLIDKAMLGTPGRHKVYILDEVHMLSKAAEAALLKTLEEPPPHVVFVLATTDPQKVSETIRSRTQHLQFRLLPMDVLEDHVRWLISDAGLHIDPEAIPAVLRKGGGSARDTISALELVAASGGTTTEETPLDEFVEALIEQDPGRAIAAVAAAITQGRDARVLAESLVAHLRDCFLCLMAPELVQLPTDRAEQVGMLAERLGPAATVRAIETLGATLPEMRHSPDPRVLVEVALVKLTNPGADGGTAALAARLEKLERLVAAGGAAIPAGGSAPPPREAPTGRAVLGGRARRGSPPADAAAAATPHPSVIEPRDPTPRRALRPVGSGEPEPSPVAAGDDGGALPVEQLAAAHAAAIAACRPLTKAVLGEGAFTAVRDGTVVFALPSEMMRRRGEAQRAEIERALSAHFGRSVTVDVVADPAVGALTGEHDAPLADVHPIGHPRPVEDAEEEPIDPNELVDAPPETALRGIDRLAAAFPGAELVDEET